MKIKRILLLIFYIVCIMGGTLLCCFAQQIRSVYFNCTPMGITLMVVSFLSCTFDYIDYIVDKIKEDKDKK